MSLECYVGRSESVKFQKTLPVIQETVVEVRELGAGDREVGHRRLRLVDHAVDLPHLK